MSIFISLQHQSKCVVLRLQVNKFEDCDSSEYKKVIKIYISFAEHSVNELKEDKHFTYIESF